MPRVRLLHRTVQSPSDRLPLEFERTLRQRRTGLQRTPPHPRRRVVSRISPPQLSVRHCRSLAETHPLAKQTWSLLSPFDTFPSSEDRCRSSTAVLRIATTCSRRNGSNPTGPSRSEFNISSSDGRTSLVSDFPSHSFPTGRECISFVMPSTMIDKSLRQVRSDRQLRLILPLLPHRRSHGLLRHPRPVRPKAPDLLAQTLLHANSQRRTRRTRKRRLIIQYGLRRRGRRIERTNGESILPD